MLGPALSHWSTALNYLQSEALRFELERSGWEKERFEFKKRIVQLEKEVEMQQRLHHDNLLRIKMLEFALQQERRPQGEKVNGRSAKPSVVSVTCTSPAPSPVEKDKATALLDGPHALFSAESREKRKTNLTTWVDNFEKLADDILHQMNASPQVNGGKSSGGPPAVSGSFISTRYSSFSSSSSSSSSGSLPFDDPKASSSSSSASSASSLDSSAGAAQGSSWNRSRKKISMRDLSSFSENKSTTPSNPSPSSTPTPGSSTQPANDSTKDQEAPSSPPMGNGNNSSNSNNSTRPTVPVLASLSKAVSANQSQGQVQSSKPLAKPSEDDGWDSIDFSPRQYHKDSLPSSSPQPAPSSSSSGPKSPSSSFSQKDQEESWEDLPQKPSASQSSGPSSDSNMSQVSPRKTSEPVEMPVRSSIPTNQVGSSPPGHQPAPQSPRKSDAKVQSPRKGSSPPSSSSSSSSSSSVSSPGVVRSESKGDLKSAESSTVSELKNLAQSLMQNSDPVDDSPESSDRINLSWSPIYTLRAHLDSVRSFSFHGTQPVMISASEDYTVKVWSLQNLNKTKIEVECIHTYFGHTGPVYTCALDADTNWAFSGGADGKVMHWRLPSSLASSSSSSSPLDPFQSYGRALSLLVSSLDFHSDAVWDLAFHPRNLLFSSSSDGTVALWDLNPDPSSSSTSSSSRPKRVIEYESGEGVKDRRVVPTSISVSGTDNNHLLVGYNSSALHLVDIETGMTISRMDPSSSPSEGELSSSSYRGPNVPDPSSQINKVVSHHMIPIAITAHEDRFIRYFDTRSGQCIHSMVGHLDSVSSLSIDPSGLFLLSGGHDSSIRMWDIGSKNCVKEFTGNRKKFDEAVNCVAHHPTLGLCASAGADSTIKFLKKRPL